MKFEGLKNSLKEQIYPVYLLEGEEDFFREKATDLIVSASVSEPQLNYSSLDGATISKSTDGLVSVLSSFPFMSDKRAVTVREWYPAASDLKDKALKNYFDNPCDTSVLIINNSKKCDSLKKISSVTVVECGRGDIELISKIIRAGCSKEKLIISTSTCKLIAEFCLYDMTRIMGEVDKLIAYKAGQTDISDDDVKAMVTKTNDYKIYEMVSFIANKSFSDAYKIMQELNSTSDKQMLFASLYYHFRRMFFVSMSDKTDEELAQILAVKPYAVTMSRRQAKSFTAKRLKKIMDKLSFCEQGFKSGTISFDGAFYGGIFNVLCE